MNVGILRILAHNMRKGSRTRRPEETVPFPEGYRGILSHDPALCTGCATCVYVCSPSALRVREVKGEGMIWTYAGSHCSYCGQCAAFCPTGAIRLEASAPSVAIFSWSHDKRAVIPYLACPACGRPHIPLPPRIEDRVYGAELPEQTRDLPLLCEACRRKEYGEKIARNYPGKE